jgi:preprotein translocase subunit SecY
MAAGWEPTMIELAWRIAVTVGALLVYRFGTFVPLPGLDPAALAELYRGSPNGIHRLAIFALGILPMSGRRSSFSFLHWCRDD